MIKIWSAYSPNNSSSYRLIARFSDLRAARESAAELARFLIDNARQGHGEWMETDAARELAARYGFTWTDLLDWSPHLQRGDEPQVAIDGGLVILYHRYCQGFGELTKFLEAKGAAVEPEDSRPPTLSVLFRSTPGSNPKLDTELAALFQHMAEVPKEWQKFEAPWPTHENTYGTGVGFRDAGTVGLHVPLAPQDVAAFQHWLASRGIEHASLRWCEDDEPLFRAIAKARCTACGGAVEYLDPRIHDIETPQFVCRPCGGFYEMGALT